ncbi:tRNA (cytidine(56)-2'-O)-methyltransferase [Candidatus Anstonella stagnisolia]|nr:tRNA (cytidine(56)-2'-O)-methyltransferase [Candidatus Anstonella stagnisolia]
MVVVLRIGHRCVRDQRLTTHVCLAARAFGAEGVYIHGEKDEKLVEGVTKVVGKWGGKFFAQQIGNWVAFVKEWKGQGGKIAHLTMYGEKVQDVVGKIRKEKKLLVVVGAEKVEKEMYLAADYNVAVTSQPHSEVAALTIFLDRYFEGNELGREFGGAKVKIVPNKCGKSVLVCNKGAKQYKGEMC